MKRRAPARIAGAIAAASALPAQAGAHDLLPGAGPLANGFVHPAVIPDYALGLVALGLLAGQRGRQGLLFALAGYVAGFGIGLLPDTVFYVPESALLLPIASAAVFGLAAAAALPVPALLIAMLALPLGIMVGIDSMPQGPALQMAQSAVGTFLGSLAVAFIPASLATAARREWARTGVRVVSAWVAASAILYLALIAKG